jgi:hypothetical protein
MIPGKFPSSFLIVLAAALGLALVFAGCGGDGDGAPSGGDASAFNFTMDNMDDAAAAAVVAFEWVPGFGNTWLLIMQALGGAGAEAVVEVPLPLCANDGTATFALDDNDDNGIDVGDTFTLTITGCAFEADASEIVDATMTVTIVDITEQTLTAAAVTGLVADVHFDFTFSDTSSGDTERIVADFTLTYNAPGELTLAGGEIRVEENGVSVYRLGCFTIFYLADPSAPWTSDFYLGVDGVMNHGGKVMTVRTVTVTVTAQRELPMPVMYFKYDSEWDEHYPDGGALELLSGGICAEAGVPSEVSATPDYSVLLEALPDDEDDIRLTLYNNSEEPPLKVGSVMMTWGQLTSGAGGGEGPGAFVFTEDNAAIAAAVFAESMEVIPNLSDIYLLILQEIFSASPGAAAEAVLPLGPLGVCSSGSAVLSLDDPDLNGPDASDTAILDITDCDFDGAGEEEVNGTVTAHITDVTWIVPGEELNTVTADATLDVVTTDIASGDTFRLSGDFSIEFRNDISFLVLTFQGGSIVGTENTGAGDDIIFQLGCFTIVYTVESIAPFGTGFDLTLQGVINTDEVPPFFEGNVFTITHLNLWESLRFAPEYFPEFGSVDFMSGGLCAEAGVPDEIPDETRISARIEAVPGDADDIKLLLLDLNEDPPAIIANIPMFWSTLEDLL